MSHPQVAPATPLLVPTCKGCGYQAIPDGEPDPTFCPKCDCDDWHQLAEGVSLTVVEPCTCPHHVVEPSQMCASHQREYIAYLDDQAELDAIQQRYEAVVDR